METYNLQKWLINFIITSLYSILCFFLLNAFFWALYTIDHPFFEKYKVYPGKWPWKENKTEWDVMQKKTFKVIAFNNFVLIPIASYLVLLRSNFQVKQSFKIEDLPTPWTLTWQLCFCMYLQDFFFYASHKLLHHPKLYGLIHKQHHEYNRTIGLSSVYTHPIEFIFGNMIPFIIPILLLGPHMHMYTNMIWTLLRLQHTVYDHSGYNFPFNPTDLALFYANPTYHDYHHSDNMGNYGGMFTIWDTVFGGSNAKYFEVYQDNKMVKMEKLNVD